MKLSWYRQDLTLRDVWTTAHGSATRKQTLVVRLEHEGQAGHGEVVPVSYHGQTLDSAEAALAAVAQAWAGPPADVAGFARRAAPALAGQFATLAGLDAAAWDLAGRRAGRPVHRLLGAPSTLPPTSYSIGLGDDETTLAKVAWALDRGFSILKVKLGRGSVDEEAHRLATIRRWAPDAILRVDANGGWRDVDDAVERITRLADYGLQVVEQPLPPGRFDDHQRLRAALRSGPEPASAVRIMLDEDCVTAADLPACLACADAVNIKLSKCGGISVALEMIRQARAAGLTVMLGCMIESSLGLAAAAQLGPLVDYLDLDAHYLLADDGDPWTGLCYADGPAERVCVTAQAGLGVWPRQRVAGGGG